MKKKKCRKKRRGKCVKRIIKWKITNRHPSRIELKNSVKEPIDLSSRRQDINLSLARCSGGEKVRKRDLF